MNYKNKMNYKNLFLVLIFSFLIPVAVFAYPNDAKTIPFNNTGIGTITILPAQGHTITILNAHIINYAFSTSQGSFIDCGSVRIAKAYYTEGYDDRMMSYPCDEAITTGNSGALGSYGQIVYVDYDIRSIPSEPAEGGFPNTTEKISNETGQSFYIDKRISYGDIFIFFFIMLGTIYFICNALWQVFFKD